MLNAGPSRGSSRRRAVVLIAALLTSVLTARLGWWQLDRAAQKLDLQARIEARGSLPPLLLAPGDAVLVQRGWMPRDFTDRTRLAPLPDQPGEVLVAGRIAPAPAKLLALAGADPGPIRQNLDLAAMSQEIGVPLRPWSVQQTEATHTTPT